MAAKKKQQAKKLDSKKQSLPSVISLARTTLNVLSNNKRLFGGVILIYSILSFLFVQGLGSAFDISETKQQVEDFLGTDSDRLGTSFALFGYMVGSLSGQTSELSSAYQMLLTLVIALASIWAVRQILAGDKPSIRDVFYKSMCPVIPFLFVLFAIGLQLLPAMLGSFLYTTINELGLAVDGFEKLVWLVIFALLTAWSLYMVTSSLFALYIVTLPDMTPMRALRSARDLVKRRRLFVFARIMFLPIALILVSIAIFVPLLMFATPLVEPLFLVTTGLGIVIANTYMYSLYRSLL